MYVALIANTAWLEEELAMFRYLAVGLIDEQVRVAQVVPTSVGEHDTSLFGDWVAWQESRWPWIRRRRLSRHSAQLEELGVDLIHALDGRLWDGALRLATRLNSAAVLTSGSSLDVPLVQKVVSRRNAARVAIAASTEPLATAIQQQAAANVPVQVIRPGVHIPNQPPSTTRENSLICAVIAGTGRFDSDYESLFTALRRIIADEPTAQFFLDAISGDQHPLWTAARRFGLLTNLSLVPRRLGHRQLLLGADMLIHPQALHRARGLTLQAMAYGIPVLAHADPWLDYLVNDQTAWLVEASDPQSWYDLMRRVVDHPTEAGRLGERARQWVRQHHRAAQQVSGTLDLYRRITGQSFKFPQRT